MAAKLVFEGTFQEIRQRIIAEEQDALPNPLAEVYAALLELLEQTQPQTPVAAGVIRSAFTLGQHAELLGKLDWVLLMTGALLTVEASFEPKTGLAVSQRVLPLAKISSVELQTEAKGRPGLDARLHPDVRGLTLRIHLADQTIELIAPEPVKVKDLTHFAERITALLTASS